ncbi:MAG: NUDIX hydrolase [Chelatococcus sp.]|jgi:8-oxo-dGTP pyrophosphatase MutT (NUDIX family)|uniref:NUDIX hydrolase n=1 Tax=unclassified Chelatococcus TaxID=2638111 RepID=UPI001BD1B851|nr:MULTISPECIES: NUDIX hydrolase [unclassified Chelatococcus]CAH1673383.1 Nudix hydrolase domain-containing protein [Hyphomicrobiales bacterium]MBS7738703.1 NUDIX hydrolase [Chelatococcus sp. HY11]MBX3537951.1 NUDIX hydrolase [Chelatococcus sp.]MBX3543107.1 NUDIX hydrolase [Chelatococcus sp.]MCO5076766.1 NUDIX hydrolase [Chelatococcus sp.]
MQVPPKAQVLRPRDSATLIILDGNRRKPRFLMGRRHSRQAFMADLFVFPGGACEAADRHMSAVGALDRMIEARLMERSRSRATDHPRTLALTAIRETFEETGLLLGTKDYGAPDNAPASWNGFADNGVIPELEGLYFVARAITPPGRSRRFDTRFFVVHDTAIAHEVPGVVGPDAEFVETTWVSFEETEKLALPDITRIILGELALRLKAGLPHAAPVPMFYQSRGKHRRDELVASPSFL